MTAPWIPGPKVPVPSHPQVLLSSREDGSLSRSAPEAEPSPHAFLTSGGRSRCSLSCPHCAAQTQLAAGTR